MIRRVLVLALVGVASAASCSEEEAALDDPGGTPMDRMIGEIQRDARLTASYTGTDRIGDAVVGALRATLREEFVLPRNRSLAYANHPLPIGHGQTISQPFIVAIMTEVMAVEDDHKVLEIGTGSGYQAAVLSHLAADVYTIEIVPELAASATDRLARLGYDNVHVRAGDGWYGWPERGPLRRHHHHRRQRRDPARAGRAAHRGRRAGHAAGRPGRVPGADRLLEANGHEQVAVPGSFRAPDRRPLAATGRQRGRPPTGCRSVVGATLAGRPSSVAESVSLAGRGPPTRATPAGLGERAAKGVSLQ